MNVIERFVIMVPDDVITAAHLTLLVETRELDAKRQVAGSKPARGSIMTRNLTLRRQLLAEVEKKLAI
jgi:DNA-binding NtrC family response regulator